MHKGIEVTDRRGYVIRCCGERWVGKILRDHPELENCETYIERALRTPTYNCIFLSNKRRDRHIYYGEFKGRVEIKVVVQFDTPNEGTIISASPVSHRAPGEKLIWHK
jgi:hypothetical protein